jgi:hypothetical protein
MFGLVYAWTAERRRWFRLIYGTEDGHPETCPEPLVRVASARMAAVGFVVDACERHAAQLVDRPRP